MTGNQGNQWDDDEDYNLEIIDDTPEADRGRELLPYDTPLPNAEDEELEGLSDRVKKRIKDLSFRVHDERRKREARERELDEAAKVANAAIQRLNQERQSTHQFERFGVAQAKDRFDIEAQQATADLKEAMEMGDADKLAQAQVRLTRITTAASQFDNYEPPAPEEISYRVPERNADAGQNEEAVRLFNEWKGRNPWFGADPRSTATAMGYHSMIQAQNPQFVGTPQYYAEIDRLMGESLPQPDRNARQYEVPRTMSTPVAPVHRNASDRSGRKRTIRLTESQVRLSRRLGLTPQQYAESLLEENS